MKVHFFEKSAEHSLAAVRKGIFKDPLRDGVQFVVKSRLTPAVDPTGNLVVDHLVRSNAAKAESANLVFGWANVTVQEDNTVPLDYQDDVIPTEVLEAAAYSFALSKGFCNQEHIWDTECGYLVECMMFTKEKMAALNITEGTVPEGLWVGFYIPDNDIYAKVKSGEYAMFSIEGYGTREAVYQPDCGE